MTLYDQHLHSRHSFDCETDPRDNVLTALDRGLAGLTFTEHFDTHTSEWAACRYDDGACTAEIDRLRAEFGDRIFIGKGIEVCYQPRRMAFILDFLASHRFDLIILSVHWAGGRRLYLREDWHGLSVSQGTRVYLEAVLDAARACRELRRRLGHPCFDVLGHLDFVKRYTQRFFRQTCVEEHGDLLDRIMRTCLEADLVPEINTSTRRVDGSEPMPGPATVRRFVAAGGKAMSLGSDAHQADQVGGAIAATAKTLRDAGVTEQVVFEDRRRRTVPLEHAAALDSRQQ